MKITVISASAAGRRCFYLGMYNRLLRSRILSTNLRDNVFAESDMKELLNLYDCTLDISERIPDVRSSTYNYAFTLHYNDVFNPYRWQVEWLDIKSESLSEGDHYLDLALGSDCIMICMDGETLQHASGSTQEIADYWHENHGGGFDIDNFMHNYHRCNNGNLPFICFVVTKMDTMNPNLLNSTMLDRIVKETFPVWFEGRKNTNGHIVAICPISALGYDFMNGGAYSPVNAEKPVLAAQFVELRKKEKSGSMDKYLSRAFIKELEGIRFYKDGIQIDISEI